MRLPERFRNLRELRSAAVDPLSSLLALSSPSFPAASNFTSNALGPEQSSFLQLPGEIRNLIYNCAIYPDLELLTIANCVDPAHFGMAVLSLPLFRVCRQIRAESFAILCATKSFKIIGLTTANAFFGIMGAASERIQSICLVQNGGGVIGHQPDVERFMNIMEGAESLKTFGLEGIGDWYEEGQWAVFVRRCRSLEQKGVDVTTAVGNLV